MEGREVIQIKSTDDISGMTMTPTQDNAYTYYIGILWPLVRVRWVLYLYHRPTMG